ncbi:MAG: hypothetical protein GX616_02630 [Planctomycetes bacterium]|nr:hypothetical protein [Planctomycetota bacterium]
MARIEFHTPSPLDFLFFAFDKAGARLSLPGAFIHTHLEMAGQVDVEGMKRALAGAHRLYPATQARLECSALDGRPRWRLNCPPPDIDRVVRVHVLTPPTEAELYRQVDVLINRRIDLVTLPPLQFHILRGLPAGDWVVVRWPHAFMDFRGGLVIMETTDRLYREQVDPLSLQSAGDELLDGLGSLLRDGSEQVSVAAGPKSNNAGRSVDLQLPPCPDFRRLGPLRTAVRRLDNDQCALAQDILARTCSPARFGAYIRACAIQALHRTMPRSSAERQTYSIPYILEGREPPYRSPVCHNVFSLDRMCVPVEMADDRAAVARFLHEGTARMIQKSLVTEHLKRTLHITRLPLAILGAFVRHSLITPPPARQRDEFAVPPSLPMGFSPAFGYDKRSFCGAEVRYVHAFRPPLPRAGIGLQVIGEQGRLAICGLCYEVRWAMMNRILDDFLEALLAPG